MSVTHHGGPISDRPQAPNEHRVRGLGRLIDERGGGPARAVSSTAGRLSIHVPVGRISKELARTASPPSAKACRVLSRGIADGFCAKDSTKTPKCPKHRGRRRRFRLRATGLTQPEPTDAKCSATDPRSSARITNRRKTNGNSTYVLNARQQASPSRGFERIYRYQQTSTLGATP
jgi:hypothetical protein